MANNNNAIFASLIAGISNLNPPTASAESKELAKLQGTLSRDRAKYEKLGMSQMVDMIDAQIAANGEALESADDERTAFLAGLAEVKRSLLVIERAAEGVSFLGDYTVSDGGPTILEDWRNAQPVAVSLTEKGRAAHGEREAQVASAIAFLTKGGSVKTTSEAVDALLMSVDDSAGPGLAEQYVRKFGDVFRTSTKNDDGDSIGVYSVHTTPDQIAAE